MPDVRTFPATRVGHELRQIVCARRRRLKRIRRLVAIGAVAVPVVASALWPFPTLLVWNSSASVPLGLYWVAPGTAVGPGDMVVAWSPEPARTLAAARRYLPRNVPLVKRVAAATGDRVCAVGSTIRINGSNAGRRLAHDPAGRQMPWWNGCRRLAAGEYLLLMDRPESFDGRYFGPSRAADLVGRARLLWQA